jgi:hypothetical protein
MKSLILANSDALSAPFRLARGNVVDSAFADVFLGLFIFEDESRTTLPAWRGNDKEFQIAVKNIEKKTQG